MNNKMSRFLRRKRDILIVFVPLYNEYEDYRTDKETNWAIFGRLCIFRIGL